ncbi:MAG: DUF2938 family protein [Methylococcales bacterium]|nr:DUF2938 family protein [Methylococcales bacterium]
MSHPIVRGIIAGLVATVVLSIMMVVKGAMGVMPELNVIAMLASKMGGIVALGWAAHFMFGVIYGVVFGLIQGKLPGPLVVRGIVLGIIGWLIMMVMVMPMMGQGLFAANMGMMAAVATFMLHVIFGAVLGLTYKLFCRCE